MLIPIIKEIFARSFCLTLPRFMFKRIYLKLMMKVQEEASHIYANLFSICTLALLPYIPTQEVFSHPIMQLSCLCTPLLV